LKRKQLLGKALGYNAYCQKSACQFLPELGVAQVRASVVWFRLHYLPSISRGFFISSLFTGQLGKGWQPRGDF
jgi:hypothetical protein